MKTGWIIERENQRAGAPGGRSQHGGDISRLIDGRFGRVRARLASTHAPERQLATLRERCTAAHTAGERGIPPERGATAHGEPCACREADVSAPERTQ